MIKNCPMRHENGNCIPAGGFCTANKNICEALHNAYRMGKAQLSSEDATSDTISRQAAIDMIDNQIKQCSKALGSLSLSDVDTHAVKVEMASLRAYRGMLENLPAVQQEPTDEQVAEYCKRRCLHIVTADFFESTKPQRWGHWILYDKRFPWRTWYKCSECGNYLDFSGVNGGRGEVNFCPNCGAKMKGERQK